jgi:hypothetical protein
LERLASRPWPTDKGEAPLSRLRLSPKRRTCAGSLHRRRSPRSIPRDLQLYSNTLSLPTTLPVASPCRSLYQRLRHAAFALFARAHTGLAPAAAAAAWAALPEARRDAFHDRALAALFAHQARVAPPPRLAPPGVKRPKSAFLCFLANFRAERKRRGAAAGALQKDICSAAGAAWRSLSAARRAPFEAQSRASKDAWARSRGGARGGPAGGSAPPMAPPVPALPPHPLWAAAAAPLPQLRLQPLPAAPPPPLDLRELRLAPELLQLLEGPLFPPEAGALGADPGLATSWIPPLG